MMTPHLFSFRGSSFLRVFVVTSSVVFAACKPDDMADQPRAKTYGASIFFPDGAAARPLVPGTVTRDGLVNLDDQIPWSAPISENSPLPFQPSLDDLRRGQEIFNYSCTPCHGYVGDGDGMIVHRGLSRPPSYHIDRLRNAAPGHFYNVMTNGWGTMYSIKERITPDDRWRVVAYIQALQLSQHTPESQLSAKERSALGGAHD